MRLCCLDFFGGFGGFGGFGRSSVGSRDGKRVSSRLFFFCFSDIGPPFGPHYTLSNLLDDLRFLMSLYVCSVISQFFVTSFLCFFSLHPVIGTEGNS